MEQNRPNQRSAHSTRPPLRRADCARQWAGGILFAAAFLAALLVTSQISPYCDDYFYGIFFRNGWSEFWRLTVWHYFNFNGRAFVHFMAELTLLFDTKLFTLLNPLMLACVFLLGGRLQSRKTPWYALFTAGAAGILVVLALPAQYLSYALLWLPGAFNYLFPLCVLLPAFWLCRLEEPSPGLYALTCVLSFLAGATTEQCGAAAVVCLGGWGFFGWLRRRNSFWKRILPGLLACAGYLTVLFAPATWVRVGNEVSGGILDLLHPAVFLSRFRISMQYLTGPDGLPLLIAAFILLTAVHALVRGGPKILLSGFFAAPAYLLLFHFQHFTIADILALAYFLFAAAVYLWKTETTERSLLLLGMLAAQLIMLATNSAKAGTAFPAILLLLCVCASLAAECMEALPWWSPAVLAAVVMACSLPPFLSTYWGYAANAEVNRPNEAMLRDPQVELAVLNVDMDPAYRSYLFFESDTFLKNAIAYYNAEGKKITYTSDQWDLAGLSNGERPGLPVIRHDGVLFFPIECTTVMLDGESDWDFAHHGTTAALNGHSYLFQPGGTAYAVDPQTGEPYGDPFYVNVWTPWYTGYIPGEVFQELFGVTWDYREDENIYYISLR